jgi:hypothetical protein
LIGLIKALKRIMSREAYESGRVRQAVQDRSREFITLMACVLAIRRRLPPTLLYASESHNLLDTWVADLEVSDKAYFGTLLNRWSNNAFGLQWLI